MTKCFQDVYFSQNSVLTWLDSQKAMIGVDRILCKTDPMLIRRHTYKCYTFGHVDFEAFKSAMYLCGVHNVNKSVFSKGGGFL